MKPSVTIVIPVHNGAANLQTCLQSILGQTLDAIEIICVDDGSRDRTPEILAAAAKGESRIRIIRNEENCGAALARNRGIGAARGEYVRFVDADDLLPARSTEVLWRRAVETGADVVRGSIELFRGSPSRVLSRVEIPDRTCVSLQDEPTLWIPWWHTSYLISMALIREGNISYPLLRRGEDPVFLAHVLTHARCMSLVPDTVYLYRKYRKNSGSGGAGADDVMDYLKHASLVKAQYDAVNSAFWDAGYGPYALRDLSELIGKSRLSAEQLHAVSAEAGRIWKGASFRRRRFTLPKLISSMVRRRSSHAVNGDNGAVSRHIRSGKTG